MNNQQTLSKIKKQFLFEMYKDIIFGFVILMLVIFIPLTLAKIFTPNLIAEEGYGIAWVYWLLGIGIFIGIGLMIYGVIQEWIESRWEKAKEKVKEKIKK